METEQINASTKEVMEGLWGGWEITVTNSKGEKFYIKTGQGVRGIDIPVTITIEDGQWSAIYKKDEYPVPIKEVAKVIFTS